MTAATPRSLRVALVSEGCYPFHPGGVSLWCHQRGRQAACQLAAVERFVWELPTQAMDPCELMQEILFCEGEALAHAARGLAGGAKPRAAGR